MALSVIGDVHGKTEAHFNLIVDNNIDYSLQLGDFGFHYNHWDILNDNHKFFSGNHDNMDLYYDCPHVIESSSGSKDFGPATLGGVDFFFVRGGYSIDWEGRTQGKDWWDREELSKKEMQECLALYKEVKPDIVISHEAPTFINRLIGNPKILAYFGLPPYWTSRTAGLLHSMFNFHVPKMWLHGHMHIRHHTEVEGCMFIGLEELGTYTIGD